jgi:signal transduction histidine kinase
LSGWIHFFDENNAIIRGCMRRIIFIFWLLLGVVWPCVQAAGPEPALAYFHDEAAGLDIHEVQQKVFQPFAKSVRLGFLRGDTWIRVTRQPDQASHAVVAGELPWVVRVGPHYLDHVWMYQWLDGRWVVEQQGDLKRKKADICRDDLYCFNPSQDSNQAFTAYFKVNTVGFRWIQLEVMGQQALQKNVIDRVVRISVALALAVALLFLGVLFLTVDSSRLMQTYCIFQLTAFAFTFSTTGAMAQTFAEVDPHILNKWGQSFQLLRVGMTVILGWSVLMQYRNSALYNGLVRVLVLSCALTLGMLWTWDAQHALELSFLLFVLNPMVQLLGVVKAQGIEPKIQKILVVGYAVYALILVYGSGVAFGWLPGLESDATLSTISDWRLNGGLMSLFVFWIVIRQHQSGKLKQLEEVQTLRLVRLQADNQAQQLKERQSLIDMLTHELKNPLSTIRFSLESIKRSRAQGEASDAPVQHIAQSVDRMDALIEHVAESNQVEYGHIDVIEHLNLTQIVLESIMDYSNPDKFNFTHSADTSLHANRQLVNVVVENLLGNAYKYASEGRVNVTLSNEPQSPNRAEANVVLRVRNEVTAENLPDQNQLFTRYYRHPNVMGISGMGIGLSLVKSAVERMGGNVDVEIVDRNVTFTVHLPVQLKRNSES